MNLHHALELPSTSDIISLLLLFLSLMMLIVLSELIRRHFQWPQEVTRKMVHVSVGLLMLLTPVFLDTSLPLLVLATFFTVFNFMALRKNLLPGIHIDPRNLGTVYYPFSFFILVLLFWEHYKVVILAALLVMAIADAAAAIVGNSFSRPHLYFLIRDKKSVEGSAAMFCVSGLAVFFILHLYPPAEMMDHNSWMIFLFALITALIATAAEALGDRGNDNLWVPLLSAIVLYFLLSRNQAERLQFFLGMLLGGGFAFVSCRVKFLTVSGAFTTFLLATVIFGFGGLKWTVPILTFFILSSVLSKTGKTVKARYNLVFEKGNRRDHAQVFANGGVAGLLMILHVLGPVPEFYLAYLGALAAATADTWATEIGVQIGQTPRLISTWKKVPPGSSGGVTAGGLLGSALGALVLALSGMFFLPNNVMTHAAVVILIITISGMAASLMDSLLGATLQVQYRCPACAGITERQVHCNNQNTVAISGHEWINNDVVNFFSTISGALLVPILWSLV